MAGHVKMAVALPLQPPHGLDTEGFESAQKVVKFVVVNKPEEQDHSQTGEMTSFEEAMLPHLDAAHNLAKWLLRNEQDAQDVVQEAYLRAFKSFSGFHGSKWPSLVADDCPKHLLHVAKKEPCGRS